MVDHLLQNKKRASTDKTMANNPDASVLDIRVNGTNLKSLKSFKYLVSLISYDGYQPERITQ